MSYTTLTTVTAVKNALKIDGSSEDTHLTLLVSAASQVVIDYLGARVITRTDENDEQETIYDIISSPQIIPDWAEIATIILIGYWYRNIDADPDGAFGTTVLPGPIKAILAPYRVPTTGLAEE